MRLICPNCGAQYEVPDDVIPEDGRDVQCSNCGHTWFETPGASALAEALALGDAVASDGSAADEAPAHEDPRIVDDIAPEPEPTPEPDSYDDDDADGPSPDATRPRRSGLDGSVADILREEAAREAAARRAEAGGQMEVQQDLGIDAQPAAAGQRLRGGATRPVRDVRAATPRPSTDVPEEQPTGQPAVRGQMFPDIEEINSTLRPGADRTVDPFVDRDPEDAVSSGFGRGFFISLLIVGLLVAVYVFADALSRAVPLMADPLQAYAAQVDSLRIWLDVTLQNIIAEAPTG